MLNKSNPIGVMDSGIGGLTVVRELQRILPGEDIIYFGDSANCPYGNKTADQIFELSCHMLQFLGSNGVKCTAVACNTISTMAERLRPCFDFRIISIVEEAAKYVIREKLSSVGHILSREKVSDLILGCTHYPIVEENFHECYPQLHLINPALEQANAVKAYLAEQNALNPQKKGTFTICTSGDPQVYVNVGKRLGLFEASELKVVHI